MYAISVLPYIFPLLAYVNTQEINNDNKYCSLCSKPGTHTMCVYPEEGPSKMCRGYSKRIMDEEEKKFILYYQNYYRNKVALGYAENEYGHQPPAAGMLQLMWHDELQEIAQRWADQCTKFEETAQHDVCKTTKEFEVGQNIITIGTPRPREMNFSEAIKDWYLEMLDYDPDWVGSYKGSVKPPSKIGHYTQLVWGRTQFVGCASVTFVDVVRKKKFWVNRLVCNYGPSGNIIDAAVYRVGRPCSKCPAGTSCNPQWGGLCAPRDQWAAPPALPVEFVEPAEWVRKKYSQPSENGDLTMSLTETSLTSSTTLQSTSPTSPSPSPTSPSPTPTSPSPSPTSPSPSPSPSPSLTSLSPSLTSPTTWKSTSPTTNKPGTPATQSLSSSTAQQVTTPSPQVPHTNTPSSPTAHRPIPFRQPGIDEEQQWWSATGDGSTGCRPSRGPPGDFGRRGAVLQKQRRRERRRWRWRVCLCPADEDEDARIAFAQARWGGWQGFRSRAGATAALGPALALAVPALTCVHYTPL